MRPWSKPNPDQAKEEHARVVGSVVVAKGKQAIAATDGLNPLTWLAESRAAAISDVYTAEVMDSLNLVARGVTVKPEAIELSEAYLKNAGRVAKIRAIEASRRIAETWRMAIK